VDTGCCLLRAENACHKAAVKLQKVTPTNGETKTEILLPIDELYLFSKEVYKIIMYVQNINSKF